MIQIFPIPAFDDNYIWCIFDQNTREAYVVDPGDSAVVVDALANKQLALAGILITHHHFDHTGGIDGLLQQQPVPVYGPENPAISAIDHRLSEGDEVNILGLSFKVITVPGHTLDHIALFADRNDEPPILFCGDTLFAGGCGRVFEGNPAMMLDSLNKLASLPCATQVYCAHEYTMANLKFAAAVEPDNQALQQRIQADGDKRRQGIPTVPSTLATELATNPFLRSSENPVIVAASTKANSGQLSNSETFGVIRGWKDNF